MIKRLPIALILLLAATAHAEQIRIAAVVNEEVITTADIAARRDFIMATSDIPATPEAQQAITPRILDQLINEALEMQEARRLSIEVTPEEIEAAIGKVEEARGRPPGSMRTFVKNNALSIRTVEQQLRAQLAWDKVVTRRLRRTVNIAQDEITRAQLAQAAAPGKPEVRIAAISLPIASPAEEQEVAELAEGLAGRLNSGSDFMTLAQQLAGTGKAALNPPIWVPEETLQPAMQQALRTMEPGQVTQPLRSQNSYQLISLLDRRMTRATPDNTEVVVKQITIPLPAEKTPATLEATRSLVAAIEANPGTCADTDAGPAGGQVKVEFVRATYRQMTRDLRSVIEHLGVTEVSEPLLGDKAVTIVMPCERIEPGTSLPDAAIVRRAIYNEKLELEAQKYLRNLRRDAFIDIKGA